MTRGKKTTGLSFVKALSTIFLLSYALSLFAQTSQPTPPLQSDASPAAPETALPEQADFLRQVEEKRDRYAQLLQDYVCRTNLLIKPSRLANSKRPTSEDYESLYINGKEIHHLLAIDGHPLSEAAKNEEDARLQKEVAASTQLGKKSVAQNPTLEEAVLKIDIFTAEQRLVRDGRAYIAFNFHGDRYRRPKSILELIAKSLHGDVLIDENDHAIVEFHGSTDDDVTYNQELLIPRHFPALVYQAKRVNDEIYVPSLVTIAIADRQPVGKLATNMWMRSLELRTYTVESCKKFRVTSTILPGYANVP
jgi:hypothetical protein